MNIRSTAYSVSRRLTGLVRKPRPTVLLVGGAKGVLHTYKQLLGPSHRTIICSNGEEAQPLVRAGHIFDLSVVSMILAPQTPGPHSLIDYQEAGLRFIEQLLARHLCKRFYVITVSKKMEMPVKRLCWLHGARSRFQHLLNYEPERFMTEVRWLLSTESSDAQYTLPGLRMGLLETRGYLELCRQLSTVASSLTAQQTAQLGAAMAWLFEALDNPAFLTFYREKVLTNPYVRMTWAEWLELMKEIRFTLVERLEPFAQGDLHGEIEGAIAAIDCFVAEFTLADTSQGTGGVAH